MHNNVKRLNFVKNKVKEILDKKQLKTNPQIIAVTKTFPLSQITPLLEMGHIHFGENKVQEAMEKWIEVKNDKIKLHLVGKLQTNKVKFALKIFDFIHSLDNLKLAKKISEEQKKLLNKPKIFIQINIGNEIQKSGVNKYNLKDFYKECQKLDLNIIGIMCLPPVNLNSRVFFSEMKKINLDLNLNELSMGMSSDYMEAIEYNSTYLRIGSNIFGKRI
jgi:hypothetical protein